MNMATIPTREQRMQGLVEPGILLYLAIKSFFLVTLETVSKRNRRLGEIRDEAFARFWNLISGPPGPPDPNQVLTGAASLVPKVLPLASGTVLELGPGSGLQVRYFNPVLAPKVRKIYAAEPCIPLHSALRANAEAAGVGSRYEIVNAGAERDTLIPGLAAAGLLSKPTDATGEQGVFDTIVCIRVLCSVRDLAETSATLYSLLKPGGKLLIVEHTKNPAMKSPYPIGSFIALALQFVYTLLGWTFFVGNCHLLRDIRAGVVKAGEDQGGWESVDLKDNFGWSVLPFVAGSLTKRKS